MSNPKPLTVFHYFASERFLNSLPTAEKNDAFSEFEAAVKGKFEFTRFTLIPGVPPLYELTLPANGHNWCFLAFMDTRFPDTDYLVCTHACAKLNGRVPASELQKAKDVHNNHFNIGRRS